MRDGNRVDLFDGASWSEVDASGQISFSPLRVQLTPGDFALGGVYYDGTDSSFYMRVANYDGTSWTEISGGDLQVQGTAFPGVAAAPNGRISACLTTVANADMSGNSDKTNCAWHETAVGTFDASSGTAYRDTTPAMPGSVERINDTTYFVYCQPGKIMLRTITDSGYSDAQVQSFTGTATLLYTGQDPADGTQVFWAMQTSAGRIYYGDNYGAANGAAQFYTPSDSAITLLGTTLAADNQAEFYWKADDANNIQHLRGYDTGSSTLYEILSGYKAAAGGAGAATADGGAPAVYLATDEQRDGDFEGRLIQHENILRTEVVAAPGGTADIQAQHAALGFPDGGILCLSAQVFPTARSSYATAAGEAWSFGNVGDDAWCVPSMACLTGAAGEFLVGGYDVNQSLVLDHYSSGNPVALHEEVFSGTAFAQLGYNAALGSIVAYATNSQQDLAVRTWSGTAWSAEQVIHSGASTIRAVGVASNPLGQWGVLAYDDSNDLNLFEYDGAAWQALVTLSSVPLDRLAGIGADYDAAGGLCVAVERTDGSGINVGLRPAGGSIAWEAASATSGDKARSLHAFYHLDPPVVVFYYKDSPQDLSKVRVVDQVGGVWRTAAIAQQIHGDPIGMAVDASGNIVLAGYDFSTSPVHAVSAIIYK